MGIRILLAVAAAKLACGVAGLGRGGAEAEGFAFPLWVHLAPMLAFGSAGALLIAGGGRDPRARALGAYFLLFATVFSDRLIARLVPGLAPAAAGPLLLLRAARPDAFAPGLLWFFARDFPRGAAFGPATRIPAVAIPLALAAGAALFAASLAAWVAGAAGVRLPDPVSMLDRFGAPSVYWEPLTLLTLSALLFVVWKAGRAPVGERRRVGLFEAGLVVGSAPLLLDVLLEVLVPPFGRWMSEPGRRLASGVVVYPFLVSVPFTTAYAVLVDQALDVRLVVRKALQYALVRYAALAMFAGPFAGAALYLYWHRAATIAALLGGRGLVVLGGTAAAAWAGVRYAPRVFDRIDRRFFREQYDARWILSAIVARSGEVGSVEELAALVTREVDHALHLESVALLVTDPARRALVAPDGAVRPLPAEAALAVLAGGRPEPLTVDLETGALGRLPESEREWLADGAFRLLVPLRGSGGRLVGLLALGEKQSELPFSLEDQRLLVEVAASAALALESLRGRAAPEPPARVARAAGRRAKVEDGERAADECVVCHALQAPGAAACRACGGDVERAPVPIRLAGKFRLERRVGGGGMGVVYRARDLALDRLVAIKTLPRVSPEYARRLRREARAIAAVSHPHLAVIFGAEAWQGTPMLVLEYLEGGTLADWLARTALGPEEVVALGVAMAEALARVHAAGVLHRDVKPSNIGFTREGLPKLLDFGVATIVDDSMRLGALRTPGGGLGEVAEAATATWGILPALGWTAPARAVGTPLYLSPEAVRGEAPEPAGDLWALALVLYEATSRRHPFAGPTLLDTLDRIARADVPDVRGFAPACPPALAAFLADALAADRGRRPPSARAFAARLEAIRAGAAPPSAV